MNQRKRELAKDRKRWLRFIVQCRSRFERMVISKPESYTPTMVAKCQYNQLLLRGGNWRVISHD
jgi:hypothetical protein